jgi:transcriptional regulator with XRE-family HTH domain
MVNGNDVKKLRAALGISQKELAEKLGVSTRTVANYEAGGVIPANKQLMIDSILKNARNVTITGDGNIANTGIVGGGISTADNSDLINKVVELEKEVIRLNGELSARDETIKGLKNELAIRIEMITFLQNKK